MTNEEAYYAQVFQAAIEMGASLIEAHLAAAQSSLETGYGKSQLAQQANNFFGIKDKGPNDGFKSFSTKTKEQVNGRMVDRTEAFRQYDSFEESVRDYLDFVRDRYPDVAKAKTMDEAVAGLQNGKYGAYATDSRYFDKVMGMVDKFAPAIQAQPAAQVASTLQSVLGIPTPTPAPADRPQFSSTISPMTRDRAGYAPSVPGQRVVSMDFNAATNPNAAGTMVVIPDDATPQERAKAEQYNAAVQAMMAEHGYANYPNLGVKTTSENKRGVPGYFHTEPFFAADKKAAEIMANNPRQYAEIVYDHFGKMPGTTLSAPHKTKDQGAFSPHLGMSETQFAQQVIVPELYNVQQPIQVGIGKPQLPVGLPAFAKPDNEILSANPILAGYANMPKGIEFDDQFAQTPALPSSLSEILAPSEAITEAGRQFDQGNTFNGPFTPEGWEPPAQPGTPAPDYTLPGPADINPLGNFDETGQFTAGTAIDDILGAPAPTEMVAAIPPSMSVYDPTIGKPTIDDAAPTTSENTSIGIMTPLSSIPIPGPRPDIPGTIPGLDAKPPSTAIDPVAAYGQLAETLGQVSALDRPNNLSGMIPGLDSTVAAKPPSNITQPITPEEQALVDEIAAAPKETKRGDDRSIVDKIGSSIATNLSPGSPRGMGAMVGGVFGGIPGALVGGLLGTMLGKAQDDGKLGELGGILGGMGGMFSQNGAQTIGGLADAVSSGGKTGTTSWGGSYYEAPSGVSTTTGYQGIPGLNTTGGAGGSAK